MIDLHSHVLPGIDDGAADWDIAIGMCQMAAEDGCEAIVATPHQRKAWPNEDPDRLRQLVSELQDRVGPSPRVLAGGEIHVDSLLLDDLETPGLGGVVPLAGTRALLIEFGHMEPGLGASGLIHELVVAGWNPVIAHPEFIPFLAEDFDRMEEIVEMGARCQVTAMSVTGDFGSATQETVFAMIDRQLIHFVASDAHSTTWRPPGLARARDVVSGRWGKLTGNRLTLDNPRALVTGEPVPINALA